MSEDATSTSKKAKKKKGKKGKSISESETPITELESFLPTASASSDVKDTPLLEVEQTRQDQLPIADELVDGAAEAAV
ncbi:MAG: hypothetical protein EOO38_28610 [Cytophagaceae bacterium]|nr:MAG: hypothetical protein EOO38_28610 [Cytophagaceae bacterium]